MYENQGRIIFILCVFFAFDCRFIHQKIYAEVHLFREAKTLIKLALWISEVGLFS